MGRIGDSLSTPNDLPYTATPILSEATDDVSEKWEGVLMPFCMPKPCPDAMIGREPCAP